MDETLQQTIEELYGVELSEAVQTYRGIQFGLKNFPERRFVLRPTGCPVHRTVFTYAAMRYLYEQHFTGIDLYLLSTKGLPYVLLGNTAYVAVPVFRGKECSVESCQDLERAAEILAELHLASEGFTEQMAAKFMGQYSSPDYENQFTIRIEAGRLPGLFAHRSAELQRFQRIARKSANRFDCAYSEIAEESIVRANKICEALSSGVYAKALSRCVTRGSICHKDYTAHNVLLDGQNAYVLNFDQCAIDLPICDLSNLIKRRMRKCGWNAEDAGRILFAYHKVRPLSPEEPELLRLLLAFPQKLWRVVNKYYNSKRTWCEKSCLMKLGEIREEQKSLERFLKDLDILFSQVYH